MTAIADIVVVSFLAYLGTMADNFVAFSAQLVLTDASRWRRVTYAQALAVLTMVILSAGIGSLLRAVPLRWLGLLALAPFAFAWHAYQRRGATRPPQRRGAVTTFVLTLGIGGDNLAVWIPLLRSRDLAHDAATLATFALGEVLFVATARRLARHPRVADWAADHGPRVMWVVYGLLGVLVLVECHLY